MNYAIDKTQQAFYFSFSFTGFYFGKAYLSLSDNG